MSPLGTSQTPSRKRVALVTGAAQGIGRAIALRLASDGLDVAVDDIPPKLQHLEEVVNEIKAMGRNAIALTLDVTKEKEVEAMVDQTVAELGQLDVMIANAGVAAVPSGIMDADIENFDWVWAVNVRGPLFCYKYAAKQMVKQGAGGRIVGASSICGLRGYAGLSAYCTSKAAIRSLTQTAALEFEEYGITVNAYAPGLIETEMTTRASDRDLGRLCAGAKEVLNLPDAKVGQPEDVAGLVSYMVSPGAHFVTGQTISINGGLILN